MDGALPVAKVWVDEVQRSAFVHRVFLLCSSRILLQGIKEKGPCHHDNKWQGAAVRGHGCCGPPAYQRNLYEVNVFVVGSEPLGFEFMLVMNGVTALGGVSVNVQRGVRFGAENSLVCAAASTVIDIDELEFAEQGGDVRLEPSMKNYTSGSKMDGWCCMIKANMVPLQASFPDGSDPA